MKFTLLTGHYTVKKGDALQLSNTDTMLILPSSSCTTRISSPASGQCSVYRLTGLSFKKTTSVCTAEIAIYKHEIIKEPVHFLIEKSLFSIVLDVIDIEICDFQIYLKFYLFIFLIVFIFSFVSLLQLLLYF